MKRVAITKGAHGVRGTWTRCVNKDGDTLGASITCPECGLASTLAHAIASNGDVSPSVVCPYDGCPWHVHVSLTDWDGTVLPLGSIA